MIEERNKYGLSEKEFLDQYKPGDYDRPSVTVDVMCIGMRKDLHNLKILLIKRADHPFINCWALPGGFVNIDESAYNAAQRELEEETGLKNVYMEQVYTYTQPNRDPRMRVIDISYMALMSETDVKAGDDAKEAVWFDLYFTDEYLVIENKERNINIKYKLKKKVFKNGVVKYENYIPELDSKEKLAFDHAEVILEGLMRLRNKLEYSDVVFNLVDKEFTLSDLQQVFEVILNKPLYRKSFRDKISNKVKETGYKGQSVVGRKSSFLYTYKEEF